jgi:hypothetical protein
MSPKTLKIVATVYLVKSLLLGAIWIAIPDLPHRAAVKVRETWSRIATTQRR